MDRLMLWDIDGTLITSRGVGRRVMDAVATAGVRGYWRTMLSLVEENAKRNGKSFHPVEMAELYSRVDDKDAAFMWLETCFRERRVNLVFLHVEPAYDNLRSDPRFADLVRRVGTPNYAPGDR